VANFFIARPIFAIVIALLMMIAGTLAILRLPIELYPAIAPPSVQINATYPGASATTVENTVAQVIEQQMSGLDRLLYLSSTSDDFGTATIVLTFEPGANADIAQVQVQNKLQLALPLLPPEVQQAGIRVTKAGTSFLLVAAFISTDGSMSKFDIANYIASHIQDPISRVGGVGNLNLFGTQYAMRIWLDPVRLQSFGLMPTDVVSAVQSQNVQVSAGQIGGTPAPPGQQLNATVNEATLLRTPQQFGAVLLKVNPDGSQVRLRDVARIALGAENFNVDTRYNGQPATGLGVQLAPDANALSTSSAVRARIAELARYFPPGLEVQYPNDATPFIRTSMEDVVKTLVQAVILVFLVMYLFLQNLRATLIPTIAVPVVLLGTFIFMAAFGFTINTLTMFGMVLAIGLLVDDAIVVVENVMRIMEEEHLPPAQATRKAMGQLTGALVGVGVVLSAVFVPVAFSPGTVGGIYRQFALTIVVAMLLSIFVALSLTPALCASFLRPPRGGPRKGFFGGFNRGFERLRGGYLKGVHHVIRRFGRYLVVYAVVLAAVGWLFLELPSAFLPDEDQGYLFVQVQTPPGTTQERTGAALREVSDYLLKDEAATVDAAFEVNGFSFAGRGQTQGLLFVHLRDWSERNGADLTVQALMRRLGGRFASFREASVIPINPPPIQGLGTASGFDFELQDRGGLGHEALLQARNVLLGLARQDPDLALVRPNGLDDNPAFKVDVDREKALAQGVAAGDIDQSFSIAWASRYVDNFLDTDNRIKRVYVQADAPFRARPEDLQRLYVRNAKGAMVPFAGFAKGSWTAAPPRLERYNGVSSMEIQGQAAPGRSTGQAMAAMERAAAKLPNGAGFQWTGISLQEIQAGKQAPFLYALSIVVVFLALAALYESWSIPIAVILVVPIGVLGALAMAFFSGMPNGVYFQIGLLTTIGLAAKNAILIVEFARELHARGHGAEDAATDAARLRARPILMTSLAFILGVLPLAIARGAGSASQHAVGIGVIGGMLAATFIATIAVPMFFVVVSRWLSREGGEPAAAAG
jgi:multidrug efflux pump